MSSYDRETVGHLRVSKPYKNFLLDLKVWFIRLLFERCRGLDDQDSIFGGLFYWVDISDYLKLNSMKSLKSNPMKDVEITIPKRKKKTPGVSTKDLLSFSVSFFEEKELEE